MSVEDHPFKLVQSVARPVSGAGKPSVCSHCLSCPEELFENKSDLEIGSHGFSGR